MRIACRFHPSLHSNALTHHLTHGPHLRWLPPDVRRSVSRTQCDRKVCNAQVPRPAEHVAKHETSRQTRRPIQLGCIIAEMFIGKPLVPGTRSAAHSTCGPACKATCLPKAACLPPTDLLRVPVR